MFELLKVPVPKWILFVARVTPPIVPLVADITPAEDTVNAPEPKLIDDEEPLIVIPELLIVTSPPLTVTLAAFKVPVSISLALIEPNTPESEVKLPATIFVAPIVPLTTKSPVWKFVISEKEPPLPEVP